jgi:hypothetical protein
MDWGYFKRGTGPENLAKSGYFRCEGGIGKSWIWGSWFPSNPAWKNSIAIMIAIEILIRINQTLNFIFQSRFD